MDYPPRGRRHRSWCDRGDRRRFAAIPAPTRADDPVYHNQETPFDNRHRRATQAQARPEKPAAPRPIKINRSAETRAPGKTGINLAIGGAQQPSWPFLMEQNIMPEGRRRMPWRS